MQWYEKHNRQQVILPKSVREGTTEGVTFKQGKRRVPKARRTHEEYKYSDIHICSE